MCIWMYCTTTEHRYICTISHNHRLLCYPHIKYISIHSFIHTEHHIFQEITTEKSVLILHTFFSSWFFFLFRLLITDGVYVYPSLFLKFFHEENHKHTQKHSCSVCDCTFVKKMKMNMNPCTKWMRNTTKRRKIYILLIFNFFFFLMCVFCVL